MKKYDEQWKKLRMEINSLEQQKNWTHTDEKSSELNILLEDIKQQLYELEHSEMIRLLCKMKIKTAHWVIITKNTLLRKLMDNFEAECENDDDFMIVLNAFKNYNLIIGRDYIISDDNCKEGRMSMSELRDAIVKKKYTTYINEMIQEMNDCTSTGIHAFERPYVLFAQTSLSVSETGQWYGTLNNMQKYLILGVYIQPW